MCQEEAETIPNVIRYEISRRELRDRRRRLRIILTDPTARRRLLLRRAYRNLSRWRRFMYIMGWAELLLDAEENNPRYKISYPGVIVWVCLLVFAALYFILRAVAF